MQGPRTARLFSPLSINTFIFSLCLLCGCGQEVQKQNSDSLAGLSRVDISDIGPWVLNEDRQLEEIPELSTQLRRTAVEHFRNRHLAIGDSPGEKVKNPKLKLFLDFGDKRSLALRGRHLQSIKLVLEDEVLLARNPPIPVQITSWSAASVQKPGATKQNQIVGAFSLLLDEFLNACGQEQAKTAPEEEEQRTKTSGAGHS